MRFQVEIHDLPDGMRAVVVDTHDNRRVVGVAETIRDAERVASIFERRAA